MSVVYIDLVEDDTGPDLQFTVKRNDVVVDLSTADKVELKIFSSVTALVTNNVEATDDDCTIESPATGGIVTYAINSTDFPVPGVYLGDLVITWDSGQVETQPDYVYIHVRPKAGTVS